MAIRHHMIESLAGLIALALAQSPVWVAHAGEAVDVELALAVDISLSMSRSELDVQRRGYALALTDGRVLAAIKQGVHGKIAVTYFEWAGWSTQNVVVPWTEIASRADAERVAAQLSLDPPQSAKRTSIAGALSFGAALFAESRFRGTRRVIDISGDGPNNDGLPVESIRDEVLRQGIIINGLPLMTNTEVSAYEIHDLDQYYADCVIGGPGAFMIPVSNWSEFPEAVRRKLVLELAGPETRQWAEEEAATRPMLLARVIEPVDCLIGEKLWSRSWMWDSP
jgi:hypothetical protein